ncbi:MAG: FadR family transcriptional regulator [Chloroflexota bacterium]|nr:FadR family transcriptional regulator [Chloroflexota bacterium]
MSSAVGPRRSDPLTSLRGAVRNPTLSQQIADELIQRILQGDFPPGESLPSEEELGRQFDVSRPVVREAVKELSLLGMVASRQGRPTRVAAPRAWNHFAPRLVLARSKLGAVDNVLLELLELRRLVETGAAGLAAIRATDEMVAEMETAYQQMEASQSDIERFVDADISFHDAVLRATGNELLMHLIEMIGPLLRLGRRISLDRRPDGPAASQQGHRAILDAIASRDAEAARRAMREHLSWTAELRVSETSD